MSRIATTEPPSDNFWSESRFSGRGKESYSSSREDYLSSLDEAPDFHDPFSDLNLFLSQQIKQEMRHCGTSKKWSHKLQEDLILKITPEFQKRFPQYRLGTSALRKTWEKISYYAQQIQSQKEAMTQDGKLNTHFFIKENLKQNALARHPYHLPPYHYAHQLAVKMSECMATVDGIRPKLDQLTKTIWAVQRHLITGVAPQHVKSPYEEYDKIDKLIVKAILEITAASPQISQRELEHQVKESLHSLHELPSFASLDRMTGNISALFAEKLYPHCAFHMTFLSEQKNAIHSFIRRQTELCKTSLPTLELQGLVRRLIALYSLASQLPKNLSEQEIREAVQATYAYAPTDKPLPQSVYAFISAESVLMKNEEYCYSIDYVVKTIYQAYLEAKCLPILKEKEADLLEILIWKSLSESEKLLEKLPYRIGQRIEEEIANILIDNPKQSFASAIHQTVQFFKKTKELSLCKKWEELDRKIHNWTIQSDMVCRWIRLDADTPLLKLIRENWGTKKSHQTFVSEICQAYLRQHPELSIYAPQVTLRIWILYKYTWYTHQVDAQESSFDRFIKWHANYLSHLTTDHLLVQLEDLCKKALPLIPFDPTHCQSLIEEKK
jgi:hypothetical protein